MLIVYVVVVYVRFLVVWGVWVFLGSLWRCVRVVEWGLLLMSCFFLRGLEV